MSQQTVTINGTEYDIHTGLPIKKQQSVASVPAPSSQTQASQSVHQQVQKSQTLNRRVVKKHTASDPTIPVVQKSPSITKFAPHPVGAKQPARTFSDIGPVAHPTVQKVETKRASQQSQQRAHLEPKPSRVIKQEAIAQAMSNAPKRNSQKAPKQGKLGRMASFGSIAIALILLGGYFAYINMPNLSVRVAAAQAGVNASYPDYRPDGYSLSGAVAYTEGQVNMEFVSNTGPQNFTIQQSKSNWDSSAVLNNYIQKKAGDNYITYNERGLTIYTYGSNAAWVNKGVLYTITGDAPLSSDQIRRIATSM